MKVANYIMNFFKLHLRNSRLLGKSIGASHCCIVVNNCNHVLSRPLLFVQKRFYPGGERGHASKVLEVARKNSKGIPKTMEQKPPYKYFQKQEMTSGFRRTNPLQTDPVSLSEKYKNAEIPNVSPKNAMEILKKGMKEDPKAIAAMKDRLSQRARDPLHSNFADTSHVNPCSEGPGLVGLPPVPFESIVPILEVPYVPEMDATLVVKPGGIFDVKYTVPPLPTTMPSPTPLVAPQAYKVNEDSLKGVDLPMVGNTNGNLQTSPQIPAEDIKRLFDALEERSLLKRVFGEEKLTSKFYDLLTQARNKVQTKVYCPENVSSANFLFEIGLLEVKNKQNTLLLSGVQSHVVVIVVFDVKSDQRIVWAYLTSEQNPSHIKLSEKQPFNFENNANKKPQMLHVLKKPFVITSTDIEKLPALQVDNVIINQQEIGAAYINDPVIHHKLKDAVNRKTLPILKEQNEMLDTYAGDGITIEDINQVLTQAGDKLKEDVEKGFQFYKRLKNELNEENIEKWWEVQKKVHDKKTFEALKERIKYEENKHK